MKKYGQSIKDMESNILFYPLVSIVIPVYNGSNYMRQAIDSALLQTYKNIEIIVVNDGSTDNTEEIAKSYGDRIKYLSKENGGVSTALNLAIENSNGEYISWLSHDDVYYSNKIEYQIKELEKLNKDERDKNIFFSNVDVYNENKKFPFDIMIDYLNPNAPSYLGKMLDIFIRSRINIITALIPKHLFYSIGFFETSKKTIQDYLLLIVFFKAGIVYKYISKPLAIIRYHKEQDTIKLNDIHQEELVYLYNFIFDLYKHDFQKMPFWQFDNFLDILKIRRFDSTYAYILSGYCNGEWNKNKPIIWTYWHNDTYTPDIIRLCWNTLANYNRNDFQIKILTKQNIHEYLHDINEKYKPDNELAKKIEYIKFSLLYKYGGIWLDSDSIVLRSFNDINKKINDDCFIFSSDKNNKPITNFLACRAENEICLSIIKYIESLDKLNSDTNFIIEHIAKTIAGKNNIFIYPIEYFSPYDRADIEDIKTLTTDKMNAFYYSFAQVIDLKNRSEKFKNLNDLQILNAENVMAKMFKLCYSFPTDKICDDITEKLKLHTNIFNLFGLSGNRKYLVVTLFGIRLTIKKYKIFGGK